MAGKLPAIPGQVPTLSDWENHLTTIFPEVETITKNIKDFEYLYLQLTKLAQY